MQMIESLGVYDKQAILDKATKELQKRNAFKSCDRCDNQKWAGDIFAHVISQLPATQFVVPPPYVPVLALICLNCGNMVFHNLKTLGVIP